MLLKVSLRESTVEIDGQTYTLREHTAAQAELFQAHLDALFSSGTTEGLSAEERTSRGEAALANLLAYLLHPQTGEALPAREVLLANVSTRMALQLVDEQARLNSYDDILGNLIRRSGATAAKSN